MISPLSKYDKCYDKLNWKFAISFIKLNFQLGLPSVYPKDGSLTIHFL